MIRFSESQMLQFSSVLLEELRKEAQEAFGPDWDGTPHAAAKAISAAFDRAVSYGLRERADIFAFLALERKLGPAFEHVPGFENVHETLCRTDLSPQQKVFLAEADSEYALQQSASDEGKDMPW